MGKQTYYNSTDSQVVVDSEGRILGGREFGEFESTDEIESAVEAGYLIAKDSEESNEEDNRAAQKKDDTDASADEDDDAEQPRTVQRNKSTKSSRNK